MSVSYHVSAGVATITLDSPANRNALTAGLLNGMGDSLTSALSDSSVRVIVLTNTGPAFCAGADLSASSPEEEARYGLADILTAMQESPKPVIGRIAGHCMGGGVGLAAACDVSIVAEGARFGFSEVRIGVAPAIISVVCLAKVRRADALELFLTGERVSAARAAEVGLVNRAVPDDELDEAVLGLIGQILAGGPQALAAAKRLIFDVPGMDTADAFAHMTEVSHSLFASEEAAEGMAAFREKRSPSWIL